ncbi:MAG: hypothetical protein PUI42_06885 [Lachnospiraceae bacterium]|nr:hypothetical protein [Lachnospiraceae bacterium]
MLEKIIVICFGSIQHTEPLLLVRIPECQPFMELLGGYIKTLTELFEGMKPGKVFPQDKEDKEQAVAGIRDNDIRKDSVGMHAAIAEYTHDTEILFQLSAGLEVDDGSAVIIVYVTVTGASTDGTGLPMWLELCHVGVKKRF